MAHIVDEGIVDLGGASWREVLLQGGEASLDDETVTTAEIWAHGLRILYSYVVTVGEEERECRYLVAYDPDVARKRTFLMAQLDASREAE